MNGTEKRPTDWNTVNWTKAGQEVRRLRQRIFQATKEHDLKKVRSLQKLMLRSYSNRLISVRRVSQENAGKRTPGVDKILIKTPRSRGAMVDQLAHLTPWRAQPVRRVYIPKANGKNRPLGIPVIRDRAIQAMVKNALEPSWEARFEATSYGFRPGRGCHDAIMRLVHAANGRTTRTWVLDADIEGAFDHISHEHLLKAIAGFPARELVKQWLKAGYMEMGTIHATKAGTPQGGVISPLLANIALHGMEEALSVKRNNQGNVTSASVVIRYADDFLVLSKTREQAEQAQQRLTLWLAERGLSFSKAKTRIVPLSAGFDFLGFTLRHYRTKEGKKSYLHTRISDRSMQKERNKMRAIWRGLGNKTPGQIADLLNSKIKGWANYFCIAGCHKQFSALDAFLFRRAWRYGLRRHPRKSRGWIRQRYFGRFHPHRAGQWVFGDAEKPGTLYLYKYGWTRAKIHREVKGTASPDDPALKLYWARRQRRQRTNMTRLHQWLAQRQEDICPRCNESLLNGEYLEVHHDHPRRRGGENDLSNLELLHLFCHEQADHENREAGL